MFSATNADVKCNFTKNPAGAKLNYPGVEKFQGRAFIWNSASWAAQGAKCLGTPAGPGGSVGRALRRAADGLRRGQPATGSELAWLEHSRRPHAALGGGRLAARAVPPRAGQRLDIRCGAMHMATSLVKTVAATYER